MSLSLGDSVPGEPPITRGEALADQAYVLLRDAILDHQLPPGSRLSVPNVARRLGISRSPAREAIARIAHEGLAQVNPRRGAVVADIHLGDIVEIYQIREVLEGLACRLAIDHLDEPGLEALRVLVREHETAIAAGDVDAHVELDSTFHKRIRRVTNSRRLNDGLDRLQGQIRIAMHTTRQSPGGMHQAIAEHRMILAALLARDAEAAERAGRDHIARLRADLQREEPDR